MTERAADIRQHLVDDAKLRFTCHQHFPPHCSRIQKTKYVMAPSMAVNTKPSKANSMYRQSLCTLKSLFLKRIGNQAPRGLSTKTQLLKQWMWKTIRASLNNMFASSLLNPLHLLQLRSLKKSSSCLMSNKKLAS